MASGDGKHITIPQDISQVGKIYRIGTRCSKLAMVQTLWVKDELLKKNPAVKFEVIPMKTQGDKILDKALSKTGEKNLFTKELEDALLNGNVDMVVNSLKDMPSTLPAGLTISAVSERESPDDAVVMHPGLVAKGLRKLSDLEPGSVVGTSSLRRIAQLKRAYPHLQFRSIRGNLQLRFKKLDDSNDFACIILAVAGLTRLGLTDRITERLCNKECLYAIGQGALAVETRANDHETIKFVSTLHCKKTVLATVAERAFLKTLGGGCSVPQGVRSWVEDDVMLGLTGGAFNMDGSKAVVYTSTASLDLTGMGGWLKQSDLDNCCESASITTSHRFIHPLLLKIAGHLGRDVAINLLKQGAASILDEAKETNLKAPDNTI